MASLQDYKFLSIDWEMTPEDAVTLYLEWGNNPRKGRCVAVRSKKDVSFYFVVDNWGLRPKLYLIKRNFEMAEELLVMDLPDDLVCSFKRQHGDLKGMYPITPEIRIWLENQMSGQ